MEKIDEKGFIPVPPELFNQWVDALQKLKGLVEFTNTGMHALVVLTGYSILKNKHPDITDWEWSPQVGKGYDLAGYDNEKNLVVHAEATGSDELTGTRQNKLEKDLKKLAESTASNKYFLVTTFEAKKSADSKIKNLGQEYHSIRVLNINQQD